VLNVRVSSTFTAALAALLVSAAAAVPAWGQNRGTAAPARPTGTSVAVIDLQEVFKQNIRFKNDIEGIKKDTEALNAQMRNEQKKLQTMQEALRDLKAGTPEYKAKEEENALVSSNINVQLQLQRKNLREREAALYFNAYEDVIKSVERFAQQNGIALVIRFSADEIDPANPDSIMMGLNRHVVYQRSLNITSFIIEDVNRGAPPPAAVSGAGNRTPAPVVNPGPARGGGPVIPNKQR
jgi:Skp family chaperone for outer membrane proteins